MSIYLYGQLLYPLVLHNEHKYNKMKDLDLYLKDFIVGHHFIINIFLKQTYVVHFYFLFKFKSFVYISFLIYKTNNNHY